MNTPKTFEEWRTEWAMRFELMTDHEALIASNTWHAAQAAVENPWHEWAKEKPKPDTEVLMEYYNSHGDIIRNVSKWANDDVSWSRIQWKRIAWQYITPSPFSVPVKSEAEKAWYENRENLEHAITHAAFCEAFNLGLAKGKG